MQRHMLVVWGSSNFACKTESFMRTSALDMYAGVMVSLKLCQQSRLTLSLSRFCIWHWKLCGCAGGERRPGIYAGDDCGEVWGGDGSLRGRRLPAPHAGILARMRALPPPCLLRHHATSDIIFTCALNLIKIFNISTCALNLVFFF